MTLVYYGSSLKNQIENPLADNLVFCSAQELADTKISHDEYCSLLEHLRTFPYIDELTVVSTCNRFELILDVKEDYIEEQYLTKIGKSIEEKINATTPLAHLVGDDVKLQFFRTYCGLNSGLIGEDEICGQTEIAFRQAAHMGFIKDKGIALLEDAIKLRKTLDESIYRNRISYCDVAIKRSMEKFFDENPRFSINDMRNIVILGSGNTTKQSCLSLMGIGVPAQNVTVIHRVSSSSDQVQRIKSYAGLNEMNFVRSKDHYRTDKVKNLIKGADLVIFGIDTKTPVIEFTNEMKSSGHETHIIDFNSNPSCTFSDDYDQSLYVSNMEADNFVRDYSKAQIKSQDFMDKISKAESFIAKFAAAAQPSPAFLSVSSTKSLQTSQ